MCFVNRAVYTLASMVFYSCLCYVGLSMFMLRPSDLTIIGCMGEYAYNLAY